MARPHAGGAASLGDLYSKCVQMVNENKISTKNAFDLPLIDHIDDIVSQFMGGPSTKKEAGRKSSGSTQIVAVSGDAEENRFHEASCTIEASARIYGCRVDCVHSDTFRILGGLSSGLDDEGDKGEDGQGGTRKRRRICGVNTLEKNENSIIQQTFEADEQSDPSFRRMAAAFDAGGARGLLLSHLHMAEDLSLVFNGDVPLSRAQGAAQSLFETTREIGQNELGFGEDIQAACNRFAGARVCPELDSFRYQLLGSAPTGPILPDRLENLLKAAAEGHANVDALVPAAMGGGMGGAPPPLDMPEPMDDLPGPMDMPEDLPDSSLPPVGGVAPLEDRGGLPVLDVAETGGQIVALPANEDAIAFDDLFKKFCGGGKGHQFAYFDECWSKQAKDKDGKALHPVEDGSADGGAPGAPAPDAAPKERPAKRPLFDLSGLDKPPKPIETEPVHKHQLSERAMHWQLHKDVPPYMIDRITMPSWPTWSKCDFACLGLRPHLMLKLQKKPAPETAGPHSFSDLFQTVVVENPEAFPWLASEARAPGAAGRDEDGGLRGNDRDGEFGDDVGHDDGENGLPSHLDVNPQDLFLQPDDRVLPGVGGGGDIGDMGDMDMGMGGDDMGMGMDMGAGDDNPLMNNLDFDLADRPDTVGNTEINYSRNSKFVDIKLVKKHLLDCITEDIDEAKRDPQVGQMSSSFQGLVDRTVRRLPKAETPNLSVAVCFICALHLCNEKDLELKTEASRPMGDFNVVGPP